MENGEGDGERVVGGNESVLDLWGGGVTLTSLVCHINNRAFGGNVATVPARWTNSTKDDEFLWDPRCQPYRRLAISSRIPSCPAKTREEGRVSCDSRVQVRVGEIGSCLFERFGDEAHLFQGKSRKILISYFLLRV